MKLMMVASSSQDQSGTPRFRPLHPYTSQPPATAQGREWGGHALHENFSSGFDSTVAQAQPFRIFEVKDFVPARDLDRLGLGMNR